ncbi:MAG: hypothetical protein J6C42_05280, partial [Clostridia bacterium]|nr:hypothetical protein [Clostridia bacterium]
QQVEQISASRTGIFQKNPHSTISAKQTGYNSIKFFAQLSFKKARFPYTPPPHSAYSVNGSTIFKKEGKPICPTAFLL